MIFFRDTIFQAPRSSPQGLNSGGPDRSLSFDMSLFDLAAKFGGLSTQESDDHEGYTGPRDYGYTQTAAYESGYDGAPPTGYPSGPQRGQAEYKRSHEGYSSSDPARACVQESAYAAPPSADEYHPQQSDFGGRGDRPRSPALPDGWIKRFDERHGRWYYVDETTGTSQWESPRKSDDDGGGYGGSQHASKDQVYNAHSGAGEAAGLLCWTPLWAECLPVWTGPCPRLPIRPTWWRVLCRRFHGLEQHRPDLAEKRQGSGYGGALLGVAGGLAVGAVGGALLVNALEGSDSEPEAAEAPIGLAHRPYDETRYNSHEYGAPIAYEEDQDFVPYEGQKPSPGSDSEESHEDTGSSESESGDDEIEAEEEFEKQSSHESSGSESGDDDGSDHEYEDQEYPSGNDDEWSGEE
ncbi:predicted protein [Verticillium alfalfae VaMs.102]|uniref:Predicted protein n=1 Tax=Verticillium alfalfae (strain VaMs.102 / ATCC MYA-4576 / FGSC 10136) TaxID=526221 RepID=C9S664_VERA1|nr:predicted protein [Verticillium alfalfae VaMs.102]EEY15126.1 predicted protein [Verticillium alfalfae VaMs.102]